MRKLFAFLLTLICAFSLSACGGSAEQRSSESDTGITALKLIAVNGNVDLEAGDSKDGYFKVEGSKDFSVDDIEFVSSDPSIATFVYDQTSLETCVYYKINALSAGTATVHAQTKDGKVKTDEITVNVTGYIYDIAKFDDTSIPTAKRMTLRVTASEDYLYAMTDEQLSQMVKFIADNYAASHKMNAIIVCLYCDGDDTDGAFTIASCTYAPGGDIEKAPDVEAGDYSTFDYNIYVNSASERAIYRAN
nr:MAG TPA: protein of unknown function (DUF4969) [Caudoviricetes sp.]